MASEESEIPRVRAPRRESPQIIDVYFRDRDHVATEHHRLQIEASPVGQDTRDAPEEAAIDVDCSTWKAERIDFLRVDDAESVSQRRQRTVLRQPLGDIAEICIDIRVTDDRQRVLDLFRRFRPDLDILLEREEIYASAVRQEQQKNSQQNIGHAETLKHDVCGLSIGRLVTTDLWLEVITTFKRRA